MASITTQERTDILTLVAGMFNAAPGATYLNEFTNAFVDLNKDLGALATALGQTGAFQSLYPAFLSAEEFANKFLATLGLKDNTEAQETVQAWKNAGWDNATIIFTAVKALENSTAAEFATAKAQLANKATVAEHFSVTLGQSSDSLAVLQGVVASITADPKTVEDAINGGGGNTGSFTLTQLADTLTGTAGDDLFLAPVTQNTTGSGALANTLETGDVIDGGAGRDTLKADLIATGTIQDNFAGAAISATTTNVEVVEIRAQAIQQDAGGSNTTAAATIDAERMSGVKEWWSVNSRADVRVEDVRARPEDVTIGMRNTDPRVDYDLYFNPLFMEGGETADSTLTLTLQEITGGVVSNNELANIAVREINFALNGKNYTLTGDAIRDSRTWDNLEAAIAKELAAQADLAELTVSHKGNGVFEIVDGAGGAFTVVDGEALILGNAADIDVRNRVEVGRVTEDLPIETNIVLDGVGNGSRGGVLNVAAMSGDRGVEVFNVEVGRNSHLTTLSSENTPIIAGGSYSDEQQLEEVYVSHLAGANGKLSLGSRTVDNMGVSTTTDDRLVTNGLTDVRVFDATGFGAELKLGAQLTAQVFDKYLDNPQSWMKTEGTDVVQFSYLLGNAGSNLSLNVNNAVSGDRDFALNIQGGAGNDRINLTGLATKSSTTINGGLGNNTVEVQSTTGTTAANSFGSFTNIQTLVVAGNNNTTQDLVTGNMAGVETVIVATGINGGGVANNTRVEQLTTAQDLVISGKNQTLGNGNGNVNQNFGTVTIADATVVASDSTFTVTLDNTARVNGRLDVANLVVDPSSALTALEVSSEGKRDTSNLVRDFDGAEITDLSFVGTQDLWFNVDTIATLPVAANNDTPDVTVNGSALDGRLVLGVDAANLDGGNDDELIGTAGANDLLAIYGAGFDLNTDVSGFETLQFGWTNRTALNDAFGGNFVKASGEFDLSGVSGVENIVVGRVGAVGGLRADSKLELSGLSSGTNVQLGDSTWNNPGAVSGQFLSGVQGADLVFNGAGTTARDSITINALSTLDSGNFSPLLATTNSVEVNNFSNITINLDRTSSQITPNGSFENLAAALELDDAARTLTINGGNAGADIRLTNTEDLNASLTRVDISGFAGEVTLGTWDSKVGTNATIVVGGYDFAFDVGGNNAKVGQPVAGQNQIASFNFAGVTDTLAVGQSFTVSVFGKDYVITNDTPAELTTTAGIAALANAKLGAALGAPANIGSVVLAGTTVTATADAANGTLTNFAGASLRGLDNVAVADVQPGMPAVVAPALPATYVTSLSNFITAFEFTADANAKGVVWAIDNFQASGAGVNVGLNNQSVIDLTDLGVDRAADIKIQDGAVFKALLDANGNGVVSVAELQAQGYADISNLADFNALAAGDAVVTSNEGLNFTIILTGVDAADLSNENFAGIA